MRKHFTKLAASLLSLCLLVPTALSAQAAFADIRGFGDHVTVNNVYESIRPPYSESIVSYPSKKVYTVGEKLDIIGLELISDDGKTYKVDTNNLDRFEFDVFDIIDKDEIQVGSINFNTLPAGEYTVSYEGFIIYRDTDRDVVFRNVKFSYPVTIKEKSASLVTYTTPKTTVTTSTATSATVRRTVTTTTTTTQPIKYSLGDVDNNGIVDAVDASKVLSEYARVSSNAKNTFGETQKKAADANKDGFIDAVDASKILAFYAYRSTNGTLGFEEYINDPSVAATKDATPVDETIYAKQGLVVKYKGLAEENGDTLINVYIENNTNNKIVVQVRDSSVNGFMIRPVFSSEIEAGKKLNDYLYFDKDELKANGITEIKNVEWKFLIFSWDNEFDDWYTDVIKIKL